MNRVSRNALSVLGGGVLLGILADVMLKETWGLNIFVFMSVFASLMFVFRRRDGALDGHSILMLIALVGVSSTFLWRDADELKILGVLAMLVIAATLMFRKFGVVGHLAGVLHYFLGFIGIGVTSVFGPMVFMNRDFRSDDSNASRKIGILFSSLKGLAIAIPLLFVFIGLFSSADPRFEALVDWFLELPGIEFAAEHLLTIGVLSWLFFGYLRGSSVFVRNETGSATDVKIDETPSGKVVRLLRDAIQDIRAKFDPMNFQNDMLPRVFTLGFIEIAVVFGLLNLLFLIFVGFQLEYLFGGFQFVRETSDMTLADYARRGFGELVATSFLVLPILLISNWLVRREEVRCEYLFRILSSSLIALLFVIMASAVQRFAILTGELGYGFTTNRFYALAFILWLSVVFLWFIATVLTGRRRYFAIGMFFSALMFLFGLNLVNPDKFIVQQNLLLMEKGREFDGTYPGGLGHDAVPILVDAYPQLTPMQRCEVGRMLNRRTEQIERNGSLLSWNHARSESEKALRGRVFDADADCDASASNGNED